MNIVTSIWSIVSKAWHLFMTVIVPTLKNKEVVQETITNFTKMLADNYPHLLEQVKKWMDKCEGMSDKMDSMHEEVFTLHDELHELRQIICKAAPTCKNVVK